MCAHWLILLGCLRSACSRQTVGVVRAVTFRDCAWITADSETIGFGKVCITERQAVVRQIASNGEG